MRRGGAGQEVGAGGWEGGSGSSGVGGDAWGPWGLGSPLARELGLEGLSRWDGAGAPPAAHGAAAKKPSTATPPSAAPAPTGKREGEVRERAASKGSEAVGGGSGGGSGTSGGVEGGVAAFLSDDGGNAGARKPAAHATSTGAGKDKDGSAAVVPAAPAPSPPKRDSFFFSDASGLLGVD